MATPFHQTPRPDEDELLVVVGPTASGKTELSVALAERFGGEVISADSVQIYTRFDVGSGKPTAAERERAPHHLVDLVDPREAIDAQRFAELAEEAIAAARSRGRVPIVCGGTFLWVKALVKGLAPLPKGDPEVRARHAAVVEEGGRAALYEALRAVDPDTATRLSSNDFVRVSRALEVFELTGKTQSAWHAEHGFRTPKHRAKLVGPARERAELDRRIEERTALWLERGWVDEVRALLDEGYGAARAMGSVGYKEVRMHVAGELSADDLGAAIVRSTRVLVRRQRTWLRDEPVRWIAR